jgi:hypothetical protein
MRKRTKKTPVMGTSRVLVGIPPNIATSGEYGPTLGWVLSTVTAVPVGDVGWEANAATVSEARASPPDGWRLAADVSREVVIDVDPVAIDAESADMIGVGDVVSTSDDEDDRSEEEESTIAVSEDERMLDKDIKGSAEAAGAGACGGVWVIITEDTDTIVVGSSTEVWMIIVETDSAGCKEVRSVDEVEKTEEPTTVTVTAVGAWVAIDDLLLPISNYSSGGTALLVSVVQHFIQIQRSRDMADETDEICPESCPRGMGQG